jgi:hypothetical protein
MQMPRMHVDLKGYSKGIFILGICLAISACNLPFSEADSISGSTETLAAASTANSVLTALALGDGTPTPSVTAQMDFDSYPAESATPTPIPEPALTNSIYQTATSIPCDVVGFVDDITIPDGTEVVAKSTFTKTWKLRNDGTCTWNSDYDLVFSSGELMEGDEASSIGSNPVSPGKTIEISVDLTAPEDPGDYIGYWRLRNDSGQVFGIGPGDYSFFVEITVVEATLTPTPTLTATTSPPTDTPEATSTATREMGSPTPVITQTAGSATSTPTATPG